MEKTFEKALRSAIESDERTVYVIGKAAGVDLAVMYRWLAGRRKTITLETADKLAAVLDLRVAKRAKR